MNNNWIFTINKRITETNLIICLEHDDILLISGHESSGQLVVDFRLSVGQSSWVLSIADEQSRDSSGDNVQSTDREDQSKLQTNQLEQTKEIIRIPRKRQRFQQ
jgi:hypothetical protein